MSKPNVRLLFAAALAAACLGGTAGAQPLRLLTWADYAPKEIVEQFTKETGFAVEVTLSNNEEMISKLRASPARTACSGRSRNSASTSRSTCRR
jgi:spermidine/putrescine transport system substrate-binding protein